MMQKKNIVFFTTFILLHTTALGFVFHDHTTRLPIFRYTTVSRLSSSLENIDGGVSDVKSLQQQAERLREEVNAFERSRASRIFDAEAATRSDAELERKEKERHSAIVPILKGDGSTVMERVFFQSVLEPRGISSQILAVEALLPLGLVLGEHETIVGATSVDEVDGTGNAGSAGIMPGDVLRACTACQVSMSMPTWQLMMGGIGQPKTQRMMFSVDGKPFEEVMEAVSSNRMDQDMNPVVLVVERPL
mmetsp:Transcript_1560/g.3292  ORF Transcript_1560/g.3292 Transcript_1560/m.3292 type:complete len:248 (-) Transcript_1560:187-930(-)